MRVEWRVMDGTGDFVEARISKPRDLEPGYTRNTAVTEWLTLNCQGDWASRSGAATLRVRFARRQDMERALARFGGAPLAPAHAPSDH